MATSYHTLYDIACCFEKDLHNTCFIQSLESACESYEIMFFCSQQDKMIFSPFMFFCSQLLLSLFFIVMGIKQVVRYLKHNYY